MRPSKIGAPVRQTSGLSGSTPAGARSIDPVIGSNTPRRCAAVIGKPVLEYAPGESHLSENIGQTTNWRSFEANPRYRRAEPAARNDVVGECAVLMMADGRRTPIKPGFSGYFSIGITSPSPRSCGER